MLSGVYIYKLASQVKTHCSRPGNLVKAGGKHVLSTMLLHVGQNDAPSLSCRVTASDSKGALKKCTQTVPPPFIHTYNRVAVKPSRIVSGWTLLVG